MHDILVSDMQEIEDVLVDLEQSADIWQNKIVKILARSIWHILNYLVKAERRRTE